MLHTLNTCSYTHLSTTNREFSVIFRCQNSTELHNNFFLRRNHVNSYTLKVAVKSLQFIEFTNFHGVCNQKSHIENSERRKLSGKQLIIIYTVIAVSFFFILGTPVFADIWVPADQQIKDVDSLH